MKRTIAGGMVALALMFDASAPKVRADARAQLEQLKALAGTWDAPLPRNEVMRNIFRPIAFGTAVLHEEWKGAEQLTATVFYLVGSELRADHYCDFGNQLHYVARPSKADRVLDFGLESATNLDKHPRHFHSTRWEIVDDSHHTQDWTIASPGKPMQTVRMEFVRVPDPNAGAMRADPEGVVRAHIHALATGNHERVLQLLSPDMKMFDVPADRDRLAGEPLDTKRPHKRVELMDLAVAGDIVAVKLRVEPVATAAQPIYELALYRVRDGLVQDLWYLARTDADPTPDSRRAEEVVMQLGAVNNRGDVEAFLALFSPTARNFRNSGEPHTLGDKPSVKVVDAKSRRDAYVAMFANGAPAQVETTATVSLGNMIAAREVAHLPTGKVVDQLSIYRIERGLIERDWFVYERARF